MAPKVTQASVDLVTTRRQQHLAVSAYLAALEHANAPSGTRAVSPERLEARLAAVCTELETATSLDRVNLLQEEMDLQARLEEAVEDEGDSLTDLEATFIEIGADWAERKGISYAALRAVDVPARVLRAAGISRSREHLPYG